MAWDLNTNIRGPAGPASTVPGPAGPPGVQGPIGPVGPTGPGGTATTLMSDTPPIGATNGALWVETDTGYLYFYYNDGTSSQWVMVSPGSGGISQADADLRYVNVTGDTMTGDLTITKATPILKLDMTDGGTGTAAIQGLNAGKLRWGLSLGAAGADQSFAMIRCDDAGAFVSTPLVVSRATGVADFEKKPTVSGQVWAAPFDAMAYSGMQINGSMEVSQERGFSATAGSNYTCDGWTHSGGSGMVLSVAVGAVPGGAAIIPGFTSWIEGSVTTAKPSLTGTDVTVYIQKIEGYRTQRLNWGFANAQPITIGFWCAHPRTGTYSVFVRNDPTYDRYYVTTYTQNVSDTWEYKTVTIPGCTDGTWGRNTACGMQIGFTQAAGLTFTAPAANVWGAGVHLAAPGQVNGVAATTDKFRFSQVVVLPGIEAPSAARSALIMRPYDQELLTCQRHFWIWRGASFGIRAGLAYADTTTSGFVTFNLPSQMRANPTVNSSNMAFNGVIVSPNPAATISANVLTVSMTGTGLTVGANQFYPSTGGGFIVADARL